MHRWTAIHVLVIIIGILDWLAMVRRYLTYERWPEFSKTVGDWTDYVTNFFKHNKRNCFQHGHFHNLSEQILGSTGGTLLCIHVWRARMATAHRATITDPWWTIRCRRVNKRSSSLTWKTWLENLRLLFSSAFIERTGSLIKNLVVPK